MSESVAEMARREADEVEGAELELSGDDDAELAADDDTPAAELEPSEGPAAEREAPSDAAAERALKQVERAGDSYTRKIATIQESTPLGLVECPLCPIPGFVLDPAPPEFDPAQVAVVTEYLGLSGAQAFPQSEHLRTCGTCDGYGFLATGSKRDGKTDVPCDTCGGNGYIDARHQLVPNPLHSPEGQLVTPAYPPLASVGPPPLTAPTVTQGGHTFAMVPGGAPDQLGRIAGHPLWGMGPEAGGL